MNDNKFFMIQKYIIKYLLLLIMYEQDLFLFTDCRSGYYAYEL